MPAPCVMDEHGVKCARALVQRSATDEEAPFVKETHQRLTGEHVRDRASFRPPWQDVLGGLAVEIICFRSALRDVRDTDRPLELFLSLFSPRSGGN